MKLYRTLSLLAIAVGAVALTTAQGCSSDKTDGTATGANGRTPPPPPSGAAPSDTPARTFALNQLYLGEATRTGAASKDAWKEYGYNIDGLATQKTSSNVCTRNAGADSANQEDGKDGIDNSFGRTILDFIVGLVPTPSKTINESINDKGDFTILLDVKGLTDDPKQSNIGLGGRLLVGGKHGEGPKFTPTDDWPYRENPVVPITGAYINNGTFVYGNGGATVQLSLFIQGVALSLDINRASITFDHKPPNDITNGTIAGVIDTEAFVSGIEKVAGGITTKLCDGALLEQIKTTIRNASDIRADGTNAANSPCNAISIGLGFTGKRIGPPKTLAVDGPKPPDPCDLSAVDGGADGG